MEPRLYQELVEVLKPFFQDEEQRTALVYEALRDSRSLQTLSFGGSATTFTLQLLNTLIHHDGEFSGYPTLVKVLETVKLYVDPSGQAQFDDLIARLSDETDDIMDVLLDDDDAVTASLDIDDDAEILALYGDYDNSDVLLTPTMRVVLVGTSILLLAIGIWWVFNESSGVQPILAVIGAAFMLYIVFYERRMMLNQ